LHLVAAHVLGRRRYEVSGRFGLRASPGGIATPAFGDGPDVVRVDGTMLVVERGATSLTTSVAGASLRSLAAFAGSNIDGEFSVGPDTPAVGDADAALVCDEAEAMALARWFDLGWQALDRVVDGLSATTEITTTQLWPEHFDAGRAVGQVNLGFSPGDGFEGAPYAYVGPWGEARPGPAAYWNAPFGAVLRSSDVLVGGDPMAACLEFLQQGLTLLDGAS
jgi:hypothetical protein